MPRALPSALAPPLHAILRHENSSSRRAAPPGQTCSILLGWVFELKHDGVRAFAVLENGKVRLVSRAGGRLNGFGQLAEEMARVLKIDTAMVDGEIAVPHKTGRTLSARQMELREELAWYAFDLLWLNGQDLRALPLLTRKQHLKVLLRRRSSWLIYVDHLMEHGRTLFQLPAGRIWRYRRETCRSSIPIGREETALD